MKFVFVFLVCVVALCVQVEGGVSIKVWSKPAVTKPKPIELGKEIALKIPKRNYFTGSTGISEPAYNSIGGRTAQNGHHFSIDYKKLGAEVEQVQAILARFKARSEARKVSLRCPFSSSPGGCLESGDDLIPGKSEQKEISLGKETEQEGEGSKHLSGPGGCLEPCNDFIPGKSEQNEIRQGKETEQGGGGSKHSSQPGGITQ